LAPACDLLGISARTVERWRADRQVGDRRCGPHHRPSYALAPTEEAQVVTVLTSSRYAGLSPKQLVPQLADEGLYLASESTCSDGNVDSRGLVLHSDNGKAMRAAR